MYTCFKGIVSLYKGRVLLFLKTFEINRKTWQIWTSRACKRQQYRLCRKPRPQSAINQLIPTHLRWQISPRNEGNTLKGEVSWPFCILQYTREVDFVKVHVRSRAQGQLGRPGTGKWRDRDVTKPHRPRTWLDNGDPHPASVTKNTLIWWHSYLWSEPKNDTTKQKPKSVVIHRTLTCWFILDIWGYLIIPNLFSVYDNSNKYILVNFDNAS